MKAALAQILVLPGAVEENLARAVSAIDEGARRGAEVVVLPECLDVGWMDESAPAYAEAVPGARTDVLATAARTSGVHVVAGVTERAGSRLYNASVLLAPDGEVLLHHRKINELAIARGMYSVGTCVAVAETCIGRIGVNICADNHPDALDLGHAQGRMGAVALLSPCAWAVPPDHDPLVEPYVEWDAPYQELAQRHKMAVIGVSSVGSIRSGPWAGYRCIGASLAVSADGQVLGRARYGVDAAELLIVDVPLRTDPATMPGLIQGLQEGQS